MITMNRIVVSFSPAEVRMAKSLEKMCDELNRVLPNDKNYNLSSMMTGEAFSVGELRRMAGILSAIASGADFIGNLPNEH